MDILNRPVSSAEREAQRKKYQEWNNRRLAEDRAASAMAANRLIDLKADGRPITNKDRADAQYGWERNMHLRQSYGSGLPSTVRSNSYKDMRADLGDTALYKRAFSDGHGRMEAWLRDRRATEAMKANRVKDLRFEGRPVTDADRVAAQQGWEQNTFLRNLQGAYDKNYGNYAGDIFRNEAGHNEVVEKSFKDAREAYNEKMYGKDRIGAAGKARSVMSPGAAAPYTEYTTDSAGARTAKLGDYGNTKQAAEGTVPSAESSMPAHEESHDTHGNEVNPFEKVVKAYNAYKAKKGFKDETPTVEPNVTGNLPPAPANLVHEWYAKEHGMERQASVMEKGAMEKKAIAPLLLWPLITAGVGALGYGAYKGYQGVKGYKETADTTKQYIDEARKGLTNPDGSQMTPEQLGTYVKDTKAELDKTRSMLSDVRGMYDKAKGWYDKYINGNQFGSFLGMGGKNWQWGLGALGLGALGYGAYRMFSGGGGSGGGWGGGAANSSAYYRNRHGYNRPDYEGMMVDNMMARRGGYGY